MLRFKYGRYKDSTGPGATPDLSWQTTILAPGAQGDRWTAKLMGFTVTYDVPAAPTPTVVADGIAAALDALAGITSTNVANVITTTRTSAPTLNTDPVSHLAISVEGFGTDNGGPYPQPSGRDGVQYLQLNTPTGGTYALTVYSNVDSDGNPSGGQTTTAIAYNASAATIQAALEALSNVVPGDVVVTKPETHLVVMAWSAQFRLDVSQVPLVGVNFSLMTGQTANPTVVQSAGSFTQVVASEGTGFDEFAVWESVPQA